MTGSPSCPYSMAASLALSADGGGFHPATCPEGAVHLPDATNIRNFQTVPASSINLASGWP